MAFSHPDLPLGPGWVLLNTEQPALVGLTVIIQNKGAGNVDVVAGGDLSPTDRSGIGLDTLQEIKLPLDKNIWLRSSGGSFVSITEVS